MKFNQLYDLIIENEIEPIEEGYKDVLKMLAVAAVLGLTDYHYTIPQIKKIVDDVKTKDPAQYQRAEMLSGAKMHDPKVIDLYKKAVETPPQTLPAAVPVSEPQTVTPDQEKAKMFFSKAINYISRNENSNGNIRNTWYKDNKGYPTIGIGHLVIPADFVDGTFKPEEYERDENGKLISLQISDERAKEIFLGDLAEKKGYIKRAFPNYDKFPEALKIVILDGFFRGDLAGSKTAKSLVRSAGDAWLNGDKDKAKKLINAAADEYLDSKEYRTSVKEGSGIQRRMKRNAEQMRHAFDDDYQFDFETNVYK